MSQLVVHGKLLDVTGGVLQRSLGPGRDRPEVRAEVSIIDPAELRPRQPDALLTLDHGGPVIGEAVDYDRDSSGHVWATCTSDHTALLHSRNSGRYFFSAEVELRRHDGSNIEIQRLALVERPGMTGLRPVEVLAGDLRLPEVRESWRWLPPMTRERVERAGIALRSRSGSRDGGLTIHDHDHAQLLERRDWRPGELEMAAAQANSAWQQGRRGPVRHSRPYPGVISVR